MNFLSTVEKIGVSLLSPKSEPNRSDLLSEKVTDFIKAQEKLSFDDLMNQFFDFYLNYSSEELVPYKYQLDTSFQQTLGRIVALDKLMPDYLSLRAFHQELICVKILKIASQKRDSKLIHIVLDAMLKLQIVCEAQGNTLAEILTTACKVNEIELIEKAYCVLSIKNGSGEPRLTRLLKLIQSTPHFAKTLCGLIDGAISAKCVPLFKECIGILSSYIYDPHQNLIVGGPKLLKPFLNESKLNGIEDWAAKLLISEEDTDNITETLLIFLCYWPRIPTYDSFCKLMAQHLPSDSTPILFKWLRVIVSINDSSVPSYFFSLLNSLKLLQERKIREQLMESLIQASNYDSHNGLFVAEWLNCVNSTIPTEHENTPPIYVLLEEWFDRKPPHKHDETVFKLLNFGLNYLQDPRFVNQCLMKIEKLNNALYMPPELNLRRLFKIKTAMHFNDVGLISRHAEKNAKDTVNTEVYYIPAALFAARAPKIGDQLPKLIGEDYSKKHLSIEDPEKVLETVLLFMCHPDELEFETIKQLKEIYLIAAEWGVLGLKQACFEGLINKVFNEENIKHILSFDEVIPEKDRKALATHLSLLYQSYFLLSAPPPDPKELEMLLENWDFLGLKQKCLETSFKQFFQGSEILKCLMNMFAKSSPGVEREGFKKLMIPFLFYSVLNNFDRNNARTSFEEMRKIDPFCFTHLSLRDLRVATISGDEIQVLSEVCPEIELMDFTHCKLAKSLFSINTKKMSLDHLRGIRVSNPSDLEKPDFDGNFCGKVRELKIEENSKEFLSSLKKSSLHTLELTNVHLESIIEEELSSLPFWLMHDTLRVLKFVKPLKFSQEKPLKDIATLFSLLFIHLKKLTSLSFDRAPVSETTLNLIVQYLPNLISFTLIKSSEDVEINDLSAAIKALSSLEHLCLKMKNNFLDENFIESIKDLPLVTLELSGGITDGYVNKICRQHPQIEIMDLSNNPLSKDCIPALSSLQDLRCLKIGNTNMFGEHLYELGCNLSSKSLKMMTVQFRSAPHSPIDEMKLVELLALKGVQVLLMDHV